MFTIAQKGKSVPNLAKHFMTVLGDQEFITQAVPLSEVKVGNRYVLRLEDIVSYDDGRIALHFDLEAE